MRARSQTGSQGSVAKVADSLRRLGLGRAGAEQIAAGEVVTDVGDRLRLVKLIEGRLGLATEQPVSAVGMLIPAVQAARQTAADSEPARRLAKLGMTRFGVTELLAGRPVSRPEDRERLRQVVAGALGRAPARHPGMIIVTMADGSTR